jgi:hypothetical protein
MAKTKISEFSATAADNTDITNINIAEGCSPANVNNAIRSLMSLLKNQQDGSSGDPFTVAGTLVASGQVVSSGTLNVTGAFQLDATAGASGQALVSAGGSNTPTWSTLGTMAAQNSTTVAITGGTITGITDLTVADGGTGASSITANSVILGNGTSTLSGNLVAPSTSGNVLKSNGTTWTSAAPTVPWVVSDVSSSSSITSGTTSYSIAANTLMVLGTAYSYMGGSSGASLGVRIKNSGGTTLFTYTLTGANENNGGDGGSGMSARSAWSVAVPSAAIGGTLEFFRVSGSASVELTINQVVKSA